MYTQTEGLVYTLVAAVDRDRWRRALARFRERGLTLTLQERHDNGGVWYEVESYSARHNPERDPTHTVLLHRTADGPVVSCDCEASMLSGRICMHAAGVLAAEDAWPFDCVAFFCPICQTPFDSAEQAATHVALTHTRRRKETLLPTTNPLLRVTVPAL